MFGEFCLQLVDVRATIVDWDFVGTKLCSRRTQSIRGL